MNTRIKTLALASALALGAVQPAGAVFVKPAVAHTAASSAAAAATMPAEAVASYTSAAKKISATHAKQKKVGFFKRIGRGFRALAGDNQLIAALLAFFLGGFGIHRFYLGYTKIGIIQLAMLIVGSVLSLVIVGIPILIALYVWVLIDLIRILLGKLEPKGGSYSETL